MNSVKEDKKKTRVKRPKNIVIIFTVIYFFMVIISVIGRVSTLNKISTTDVNFIGVAKEFWFSIVVIILLVITIIAYNKKGIYGVSLEFAIGLSMLANVLVSVITVGFNIVALLGTLILPSILIAHSILTLKSINKQKSV